MDTGELTDVLRDAGLSPYQADAYVTLLELGSAPAQALANASGVPGPRIYDVLRDLQAEGYVVTYERDELYARANDPEEALSDIRGRIERFESAVDEVQTRYQEPDAVDGEVRVVQRFETVFEQARRAIEDAERHVQAAVSLEQFLDLRRTLAAAHERGVYVQVSLYVPDDADEDAIEGVDRVDDQPLLGEDAFEGVCTEVRLRELPEPFLVLADRQQACYATRPHSTRQYGVIVDDQLTTYVFHWFFLTTLWAIYEPVYVARDTDPPVTFVEMRECIRRIEPLLTEGASVEVRVFGTEVRTGRSVEFVGTVVDVLHGGDPESGRPATLTELAGRASLVVDTGEETYNVGGQGAFIEDVAADRVQVERVDGGELDLGVGVWNDA